MINITDKITTPLLTLHLGLDSVTAGGFAETDKQR